MPRFYWALFCKTRVSPAYADFGRSEGVQHLSEITGFSRSQSDMTHTYLLTLLLGTVSNGTAAIYEMRHILE